MRLLLTGTSGQVGGALFPLLPSLGEVLAPTRAQLDLENPDSIIGLVRTFKPDVVINAAAYTAVDRAEEEPERAMAVNGLAPGILAEETRRLGALLVHYSTDYVFDGRGEKPWREDAPTSPLNQYGKSKLSGEQAIMAAGDRWLLLRTSWVYGMTGHNFLRTMLRLAAERDHLRVVNDQIGAPTWSADIAAATLAAVARRSPLQGLFHLANQGETSWAGFARRIMVETEQACVVESITSADYPLPAPRPLNSRLDTTRLAGEGIRLPHWETALHSCLEGDRH